MEVLNRLIPQFVPLVHDRSAIGFLTHRFESKYLRYTHPGAAKGRLRARGDLRPHII